MTMDGLLLALWAMDKDWPKLWKGWSRSWKDWPGRWKK